MDAEILDAIKMAVQELDAEHQPMWAGSNHIGFTTEPRPLFDPVGCNICYPRDGSWPCTSAMVANDLRKIMEET